MFKNYFKIAIRKLMKNKVFSFINIVGLCVGITSCLLITLFVNYELNYDDFQKNGDRIVRVIMEYSSNGNVNKGNFTSTKVGPSFKEHFPEVENFVRMSLNKRVVKNGEKMFMEARFIYTDSTFFDMFSIQVLKGDKKKLLSGPNSIVLSEIVAKKYFNNDNPVGKTIKVSTAGIDYVITGVINDCPKNSHIKYDFLASFSSLGATQEETYWNANYTTYLLLKNTSSIKTLQPKISAFMRSEMKDQFTDSDYLTYQLEPFMDIHLKSEYEGFESNGSMIYIYIISAIALLILLLASFTFINLSTAASVERAKEIGIRKVVGAFKAQIFWQFIGESFLIVLLSTILSFLTSITLLPLFNELVDRDFTPSDILTVNYLFFSLLLGVLIGFLSGSYPALVISSFQPIKVLKGSFKNTGSGLLLRKLLFTGQFVISILLLICSTTIQKQLYYLQNKNLGFNKEHVVVLPADSKLQEKFSSFKTEIKRNPNVYYVTKGDFEPCNIEGGYSMSDGDFSDKKSYLVNAGSMDVDYLNTCGIKIIKGSDITSQDVIDASQEDYLKNNVNFILNESAIKQMGWTIEEAIGKKMNLGEGRNGIVKAVVQDFHFASLHQPIKPLVLFPSNYYASKILIKTSGNNINQTISSIEKAWKLFVPNRPFEYSFLDENYMANYKTEIRLGKAINIFAFFALALALLGLYGLSAYTILQRTKEIGVLKIFGASIHHIIIKLSKNFITLIIISICFSFPISWLIMSKWLQGFSYRIELTFTPFLIAGIITIVVSLITIAINATKAALSNPIKSLRTE